MAALNRRHPNLDDFVGLNWSCWADMVNILPTDVGLNDEDGRSCGKNPSETMTLMKEDMHIYGHCPAHDDFYLVVCSHCDQVVKPGAFEKHCERRHGPLTKMCGQSSTLASQQRPRPGQPPSNLSISRDRQKDGRCHEDGGPSSTALPVPQHRPTKPQRDAASLPSVVKGPQESPSLPQHSSSTPRPRVPPWQSGTLHPGLCSSSTPPLVRPSAQRSTAGPSPESQTSLRGTRTYSRMYKNTEKKECDLNKHNRTVDPERKKLSSREPLCNTDLVHQQQKSQGRTKAVDHFSPEQRDRLTPAGRDVEQLLSKLKDKEEAFEEKLTQSNRFNTNNNGPTLGSRDAEESLPEEEGDSPVDVTVQPPYPFNQSLVSSEESEDNEQEEDADLPASPWHPKPLGLCTFGCRTLGCSIFTFDRRLHHLRFALTAMLEHHVSAHLWKKMPQVSPGLRSCHVTPPAVRSPAKPFQSTGTLSLDSTSLGHMETKSSQHNLQSTKPPPSTSSTSRGPGQWRGPIGRHGKPQLKEVVLTMPDANATQKMTRLTQSHEDKSSRCIGEPSLYERVQPRTPPQKRPSSGNVSRGKKPCPPLPLQPSDRHLSFSPPPAATDRSPFRRASASGIPQRDMVSPEQKIRGQKRKGSKESPPLSSSGSKTSKCKRFSSPTHSSLLSLKGENIGDALSWGLDKTSNS